MRELNTLFSRARAPVYVFTLAALIGCFICLAWNEASTPGYAEELPTTGQPPPATLYDFPTGTRLTTLGLAQTPPDHLRLREAYKALFHDIYDDDWTYQATWSAIDFTADGTSYSAGTIGGPLSSGAFTSTTTSSAFTVDRSFALQPIKIGIFYSAVRDEYGQVVTWEEGDFEQLFRVYLWGENFWGTQVVTVTETAIQTGTLAADGFDMLILPSLRLGYADEVSTSLGSTGLANVRAFVEGGGVLYTQGEAAYLAQAAGVVPTDTVDLNTRVTEANNEGGLTINDSTNPLTFSWLRQSTYVLNEPLLKATTGVITAVATYTNTTQPGSPAILYGTPGQGKVILMSGHPSDKLDYHPQVLDAVLLAMARRAGLTGELNQQFAGSAPANVIPAYEADVPIMITTTFENYWDVAMTNVVVTETVSQGFTVDPMEVSAGGSVTANANGTTTIVWQVSSVAPGDRVFTYTTRTQDDTMAAGSRLVSIAQATYYDPVDTATYHLTRKPLYVQARMAGRLNGDRDIELDGLYPLPAEGYYFDIALTLENKEETIAGDTVVTDVVALISPIVDVDDQHVIPQVVTYTVASGVAVSDTLWARNDVFFYDADDIPLPVVNGSAATTSTVYTWRDATAVYTITGSYTTTSGLSNSVTYPVTYTGYITVTPQGDVVLPALVMVWDLGDFGGYDYEDPSIRYGFFSQELLSRTVTFITDPMTDSQVIVLYASGGSVFTNLGGDPIPYHEYLRSGIVHTPTAPTVPQVSWQDLWGRQRTLDLRTVFYDIVPFPPPEYHAVVNATYGLTVDFDDDGVKDDRVLEFPSREEADLHVVLKSHSNFALPLNLERDETLISFGMFKGLGFQIEPRNGTWANSWSFRDLQNKGADATVLTATVTANPAYTYLYFQQELDAQAYEVIDITGTLQAYPGFHREGVMKLHDGARFVYHQKALGPSRYEVFDSHVQAVFGVSSDAEVSKWVAPALIATYGDDVYHFIRIEDLWEPHDFGDEPFLKSYGFDDSAATVYVGGRDRGQLLSPKVAPGETTRVRIEVNNNTDTDWTGVSVTYTTPSGFTITPTTFSTALQTPIFFDFPFLNTSVISNAWKGVYYFDVTVDAGFSGQRGQVYTVPFTLQGTGVPADFQIPSAMIGVADSSGNVKYTIGRATDLWMTDLLPSLVTPVAAKWGTEAQKLALEQAIITGTGSVDAAFNAFQGDVTLGTSPAGEGTQVNFTMPAQAQKMPWISGTTDVSTLYVVLKSRSELYESGTNTINYGPVITYTDFFNQQQTDVGNAQTVEVHGARIEAEYTVNGITRTLDGEPLSGVELDTENAVDVTVCVYNRGDYIATMQVITVELASGVTISTATPSGYTQVGQVVEWTLNRDLAPADSEEIHLVLLITPGGATSSEVSAFAPPAPGYHRLLEETGSRFQSKYPPSRFSYPDITRQVAGPLDVAQRERQVYLPLVLKNMGDWWPQSSE
jgi:hypothetical protein